MHIRVIGHFSVDLDRGTDAPRSLRKKIGNARIRPLANSVLHALRPLKREGDELVRDTSTVRKLCLQGFPKLGYGRSTWPLRSVPRNGWFEDQETPHLCEALCADTAPLYGCEFMVFAEAVLCIIESTA
jgi:hypothetical protein